jgi:hypothetical protein
VIFKATLDPSPRPRRFVWFFGDGCASAPQEVTDPRVVSATHAYRFAGPGQRFTARVAVVEAGVVTLAEYPVSVVEPTPDHQATVAIDDGLWALHASMVCSEDPRHGPVGTWGGGSSNESGITAMATLAFLVNGFDLRPGRAGHAYEDTVKRGLALCLSKLAPLEYPVVAPKAGAPLPASQDGHALVALSGRVGYSTPLVALALIAAGAPDRAAGTGNPAIAGRSLRAVGVDLIEGLVHGQRKVGAVGGWRYELEESGDADMSVTQWPALALLAAEREWGVPIDAAVKRRLDVFLADHQGQDGAFGYQRPGAEENVGLTAAGLIGLECAGVDEQDERCTSARAWIGAHWDEPTNVGDGYSMYAVMKAAKLSRRGSAEVGGHDWHAEYLARLASTQGSDGRWPEDRRYARGALATAWPCLILAQDVFASAEPVRPSHLATIALGALALQVGAILLVAARRLV